MNAKMDKHLTSGKSHALYMMFDKFVFVMENYIFYPAYLESFMISELNLKNLCN